MIESPMLNNLIEEQVTKRIVASSQKHVLAILEKRLGPLSQEVVDKVRSIDDENHLDKLVEEAAISKDLDAVRQKLEK